MKAWTQETLELRLRFLAEKVGAMPDPGPEDFALIQEKAEALDVVAMAAIHSQPEKRRIG